MSAAAEINWDEVVAGHRRHSFEELDRLESILDDDVSELSHEGSSYGDNPDIETHRCTALRWIGQHHKQLGRSRSIPGRCWHCVACSLWHRAQRLGRLFTGLLRWERVEMVRTETPAEYEALTRRLRRLRERSGLDLAHVSIPYQDGARVVFTEAEVSGELVDTAPKALLSRLETLLVGVSSDKKARIDGSKNWEKNDVVEKSDAAQKKKSAPKWEKVGETTTPPAQQEKIYRRFGCKPVEQKRPLGRRPGPVEWDVSHLSELELEKLWWSLGFTREAAS